MSETTGRRKAKQATVLMRAHWEYLDGIEGLEMLEPNEFTETAREIPVALIEEYENAEAKVRELAERIMACPVVPNPTYEPPEEDESDD